MPSGMICSRVYLKMKNNYLLKVHQFYEARTLVLKEQVRKLKASLPAEEYSQHEVVKLAARLRKATLEIIPEDPNKLEYQLKAELKKFRRYKQGLQRYRLIFAFSSKPSIILYLYVNDQKHLRQDGGKNDPYEEFVHFLKRGVFSHDPQDTNIQKWIRDLSPDLAISKTL